MSAAKIFNKETESNLKSIITDEFIQASKNILSNLAIVNGINKVLLDETTEISIKQLVAEGNRGYYIGQLENLMIVAETKQENGEELTEYEKQNMAIYNGYINLIHNLYPIAAARQIAFNSNAKTVNAVHDFALTDAKAKAYGVYENTIKENVRKKNIYC